MTEETRQNLFKKLLWRDEDFGHLGFEVMFGRLFNPIGRHTMFPRNYWKPLVMLVYRWLR